MIGNDYEVLRLASDGFSWPPSHSTLLAYWAAIGGSDLEKSWVRSALK